MDANDLGALNQEVQQIWEGKAAFWDKHMGDGTAFQRVLVGPASERLLHVQPGDVVLDSVCRNGVFSRRLAALGAHVIAADFSPTFLERAHARTTEHADRIEYVLADVTDETQLLALGVQRFDAVACNMALQDIATIEPLLHAVGHLLKPGGRFVFSMPHPEFNSPGGTTLALEEDRAGELVETYYVKVRMTA